MSARARPRIELVVDGPGVAGRRVAMAEGTLLIGRDAAAGLRLDHPDVSRVHARLGWQDAELWIDDLSSANGTRVNGERIQRARLDNGASVDIGPFALRVELSPVASRPALDSTELRARTEVDVLLSLAEAFDSRSSRLGYLKRLLDSLVSAVHAERGFVYALDRSAAHPVCVVRHSIAAADGTLPVSHTLVLAVARERAPRWLVEMDPGGDDETGASVQRLARERLQSVIVTPLLAGGRLLGVLYLDSRARLRKFGEDDAALVEAASRAAGHMLAGLEVKDELVSQNRRLWEMVQDARGRGAPIEKLTTKDSPAAASFRVARRAAASEVSVLIRGESGTGKELVARRVHELSARRSGPFVAVNCGALPEGLVESELFGHRKGAFTGALDTRTGLIEAAHGGTLFLDEIGELPAAVQSKLLRVLEERTVTRLGDATARPVNFRLVAATHRDLAAMVASGSFRQDLYYRINVLALELPPLRDRPMDIPLIAGYYLDLLASAAGSGVRAISPGAMERLKSHAWPGNIRELRNVIERALVLADGDVLTESALPPELMGPLAGARPPVAAAAAPGGDVEPYDQAHERFERDYFERLVERLGSNITAMSRRAGLARLTIYRRLAALGLRPPPGDGAGGEDPG